MKNQWSTFALGNKGRVYKIMLLFLPVIPSAMIAFAWYILYAGNDHPPKPIIIFAVFILLVFGYQILEVVNFLRIERFTAKDISIKEKKITLRLL